MKKITKSIILFSLLIFPVIIFVFLKLFGVNQYDVPVYFGQGVDTTFTDCEFEAGPHLIPEFNLPTVSGDELTNKTIHGDYSIFYFVQDLGQSTTKANISQLVRVQGSFEDWNLLNFVVLVSQLRQLNEEDGSGLLATENVSRSNWYYCSANPVYSNQLARCGFVLDFDAMDDNVNSWVIVVDNLDRIRGYYNIIDPEEIDRLIVELRILKDNHR